MDAVYFSINCLWVNKTVLYPLELSVEWVSSLQEASLLVLVAVFNLQKFSLQLPLKHRRDAETGWACVYHSVVTKLTRTESSLTETDRLIFCILFALMSESSCCLTNLVHHQRLDLPLKDLHTGCGDHWPNIRHHNLTEDVADEPVVPLKASSCCMLHWKSIVIVWMQEIQKTLMRLEIWTYYHL